MRRLLLPLLALLLGPALGLPGSPAPAHAADDWPEARKAFLKALKSDDWKVRSAGFGELSYFDNAAAVGEVLGVLASERHPAVLLAGIRALGGFKTLASQAALAEVVRKGKDPVRLYTILALADQPGTDGKDALLEVLQGRDAQAAAQAALALGKKQVMEALPHLLSLLHSKEWRVRAAAARAVRLLAGPIPTAQPGKPAPPATPKALAGPDVLGALIDALEVGEGRERADVIQTLARLTQQDFGWDLPAWRAFASGTPAADIARKPQHPTYFFGVPVFGRRVVVLVDNNVRTEDAHPFSDRTRLQAVCAVPGARPVPWFELRTIKQLINAHVKRTVTDLASGSMFDLVVVGGKARSVFGKLSPANDGSKGTAITALEEAKPETANDVFTALDGALDIASRKDSVAWDVGPEEILYAIVALPWLSEQSDPAVVAAAIALKARLRMVPITLAGVGEHPYELCQTLADATGGTYINLSK
jgi:hypothetical protein